MVLVEAEVSTDFTRYLKRPVEWCTRTLGEGTTCLPELKWSRTTVTTATEVQCFCSIVAVRW